MLTDILIVLIIILIIWYINIPNKQDPSKTVIYVKEGFKPFEPDNSVLQRNPFDDFDYIMPEFKIIGRINKQKDGQRLE